MRLPSIALRSDARAGSSGRKEADGGPEARPGRSDGGRPIDYFGLLWRAGIPLPRVLWYDMLTIGTIVNLLAGLIAFLVFSLDGPTALGVAVFLAPVPYNLLLFLAVWRAASREPPPYRGLYARIIAVVWLALAFAI